MARFFATVISCLLMVAPSLGQHVFTIGGLTDSSGWVDGHVDTALLNNPHGIDVGPDGSVYIADRYNHLIRKLDTNGVFHTVAGTGIAGDVDGPGPQAQFNEPWDVAVDELGVIYIADSKNNKIKSIDADGLVKTVAGTGSFGFADRADALNSTFGFPSEIEIDFDRQRIYVSDHLTHLIRMIDQDGVHTVAGTKEGFPQNHGLVDGPVGVGKLYRPYGITLAQDGALWIADEWNHAIRKLTPEGMLITMSGTGNIGLINGPAANSQFNFPWDICQDDYGYMYVMDGYNNAIRIMHPDTLDVQTYIGDQLISHIIDGPIAQADLIAATGCAYDAESDRMYFTQAYHHLIRAIDFDREKWEITRPSDSTMIGIDTLNTAVVSDTIINDLVPGNDSGIPETNSPIAGITIPNVFTPNGDGQNDSWHIRSEKQLSGMVMIFNRWGTLLANLDLNQEWKGTHNGVPVPDGTYYYVLQCDGFDSATGHIQLLR